MAERVHARATGIPEMTLACTYLVVLKAGMGLVLGINLRYSTYFGVSIKETTICTYQKFDVRYSLSSIKLQ